MDHQTESYRIGDNSIFGPLPYGWEHINDSERICSVCGDLYYKRIAITPGRMIDAVRTKCSCFGERTPEEDAREMRANSRRLQLEIDRFFGSWNLLNDEAYNHMRIEKFVPENETHEQALRIAREFIPSVGSLLFYGRGGRGKTHMAVSIAKKVSQMGYSALVIKSIDFLNRLRKCYQSNNSDEEIELIRLLKNVELLVIDDLGTEKPTGWVKAKFYEVIDYRSNRRATLFTTNLGGEEMEKALGQGIVSRVWSRQVEMLGPDHRMSEWADIGREIAIDDQGRPEPNENNKTHR